MARRSKRYRRTRARVVGTGLAVLAVLGWRATVKAIAWYQANTFTAWVVVSALFACASGALLLLGHRRATRQRAVNIRLAAKTEETCLYEFLVRYQGLDFVLGYLGISNDGPARLLQHAKDKGWFRDVQSWRIRAVYPTRAEALAAEEAAIKAEHPLYNQQHNARYYIPWTPQLAEAA